MYCTNCGKELKRNQNFCTNCGNVVRKEYSFEMMEKDTLEKIILRNDWIPFMIIGIIIAISTAVGCHNML